MALQSPRGILFDLDGTLIDSRRDIAIACNAALQALGHASRSVEQISGYVGDGARILLARALEVPPDASKVEEAYEVFVEHYAQHPVRFTSLMPGVVEALEALERFGVPFSIVTNKSRRVTERVLEALGLASRAAAVAAGGDGPLKPSPCLLERALGEMQLKGSEAWMVGDGAQDILAGKAASCTTVAVLGGFQEEARLLRERPDAIWPSLERLPQVLADLAAK